MMNNTSCKPYYLYTMGGNIELDPMFNQGMFYKNTLVKPKYRFDLEAEIKGYDAEQGDATNLPLENESVNCMILDPPFMFGTHGQTKNNVINKRYTMFDSFAELETLYKGILAESFRVLRKDGLLIFKCQDYTDSKTTMTHCLVWKWATDLGFYAKDLAILEKPNKIYNGNLKQKHLRKTHSYFYVFIKKQKPKNWLDKILEE